MNILKNKEGQVWADPLMKIIIAMIILSILIIFMKWLLKLVDALPG